MPGPVVRRRLLTAAVTAALALTSIGGLVTVPAQADDPPGTISGTVSAADTGNELGGAFVAVYPADDPSAPEVASECPVDGSYAIDVPPGRYVVELDTCWGSEYDAQWWDHAASRADATVVTVGSGEQVSGIDAALLVRRASVPTAVTVTGGIRSATLQWGAPARPGSTPVTGYNVERWMFPGGDHVRLATDKPATAVTDTGLADGTSYEYSVVAVNGAGAGDTAFVVTRTARLPEPPSHVTTWTGLATEADIAWQRPIDTDGQPVTGYTVYRSTSSTSPGVAVATNLTSLFFHDQGLTEGTTYYYSVTATTGVGESRRSDPVAVTPWSSPTVSITGAPPSGTSLHSATFTFTGHDPANRPLTFECSLDDQQLAPCQSPMSYAPVASGHHSFGIRVTNSNGQVGYASSSWTVDDEAPTGVAIEPLPAVQLPGIHDVFIDAQDVGAGGVASYDTRQRIAAWNGSFDSYVYPLLWQRYFWCCHGFTGVAGHTYCFSGRASDSAGNVSPWSADRCTTIALDDRSLHASSGWRRMSGSRDYRQTVTRSSRRGATLTLPVAPVRRVAVVVRTCPTCGSIAVLLGGHYWRTISTRSPDVRYQRVLLQPAVGLRRTTVTLRVVSTGRPVWVDGIAVSQV